MKHKKLILFIIAINAFVIGLTEFISVGLIPMFVQDFSITESIASLSVSFYALGVIIGAPLLSLLTNKLNRKNVLVLVMTIFILGNSIVLTAGTFSILILGRFISAFAHGLFMTAASNIAAGVVAKEKQASAIAIMFTGLTVATIFGVPVGTFLATYFTWQVTFALITLLGVLSLILNLIFIPKNIKNPKHADLKTQFTVFKSKQLLFILLITALAYGSTFIIYTFISPLLINVGFTQSQTTLILFVYGVMVAIGNTIGGKYTNHNTLNNLNKIILGQVIIFTIIAFVINMQYLLLISLIIMGLFAFMNVPGLQLAAIKTANAHTPDAINFATSLNISAFNLGIAGGSFIGGILYANFNHSILALVAAIIAIVAIILIQLIKKESTF